MSNNTIFSKLFEDLLLKVEPYQTVIYFPLPIDYSSKALKWKRFRGRFY